MLTGHCPCNYFVCWHLEVLTGHYLCNYFVCKTCCKLLLVLSSNFKYSLVIKDWGCGKETVIFIYLFFFVNFMNSLV